MKKGNKKVLWSIISVLVLLTIAGTVYAYTESRDFASRKAEDQTNKATQNLTETDDSFDVASKDIGTGTIAKVDQEGSSEEKNSTEEKAPANEEEDKASTTKDDVKTSDKVTVSREDNTTTKPATQTTTTKPATSSTTTTTKPVSESTSVTTQTEPKTETPEPAPAPAPVEEPKANTVAGAFFVSKSGNDANPGTESAPWKTIQKAANTLQAGQTVYIKAGTYNERVVLKNSGSSGNYITYTNYPGDTVVIDGAGIDWGYSWGTLFNVNSRHYIKINGLRVVNSRWGGIGSQPDNNGSQNVIVTNCSTYNTKASGIAFYHAANITVDGNSIEKACTAIGSQEAISISNVATFTIRNNKVFNITNSTQGAGGEAIDAKNGSSNGKIYNNTIHDIAKIGIYIDAYSKTSSNIEVYGNNIYNCGQGIAVATEKSGLLRNVNIHNNSIKNCSTGYAVGGWSSGYSHDMDTIKFNANTLTGITSRGVYLNNPDAKNVYITNNKISGSSSMIPIHLNGGLLSETTIDGNIFDRTIDLALAGSNYTFLN
ncbi:right-handed parallel beta-helix repeat-containing protein [Alkalibacter rhizosphaerae]|uniref:Right-handed parallel beta-helix repeat-containing protein n=1 Tax=Alkalibacter rhizosphaerae TaxID=2815577 RepID=A0A974XGT0_9FIRM|nr:right-handed parallel beta-helix repeat-containing protein [Alkalibacter rhizosphaerae]QSX09587.1 right-handed parallel beta-helix repeat-containing protein [Alkalibacter rhizosphaerae]